MEPELTPDQEKLLVFYCVTGLIETAARLAEVSPTLHEESLQTSLAYTKAYARARRDSARSPRERGQRHAPLGTDGHTFHGGGLVRDLQRLSDRQLIRLLQVNNPAKFKRQGT